MGGAHHFTLEELMAVTIARDLKDGERGFTGLATGGRTGVLIVGIPLAAMALAKRMHAPALTILYTGHIADPVMSDIRSLYESGPSLAAVRCGARLSPADVMSMVARGEIDFGFCSGAQVDQYGNINTSVLGGFDRPVLRMLGSVLLPEHFTLFGREYVVLEHNARRLVSRVDFISAPGYIDGPGGRARAGLTRGGPRLVLTELGVFDFEPETCSMRLRSLHPGRTLEQVRERTGFELIIPQPVERTKPPSMEELRLLREEIDPHRVLLGDAQNTMTA